MSAMLLGREEYLPPGVIRRSDANYEIRVKTNDPDDHRHMLGKSWPSMMMAANGGGGGMMMMMGRPVIAIAIAAAISCRRRLRRGHENFSVLSSGLPIAGCSGPVRPHPGWILPVSRTEEIPLLLPHLRLP